MTEWLGDPLVISTFFPEFGEDVGVTATSPDTEQAPPETENALTIDVSRFASVHGLNVGVTRGDVYGIAAIQGIQDWNQTEHKHTKTARLKADINDLYCAYYYINMGYRVRFTHETQWHKIVGYENNCTYDSQNSLKRQGIAAALEDVKLIFAAYMDEPEDDPGSELHYEHLEQYIKDFGAPIIDYLDEMIWDNLSDQSAFMALEIMGSIYDVVTKALRREIIIKGLKHEHAAVRLGAINGIACLEDRGLIPELEKFIKLESSEVVLRACERVLNFITKS